jgi:hypothetical protein
VHIDNQEGIDALFAPFLAGAVVDFRTVEEAEAAVDPALPRPRRLGALAYVRPGVGNIIFSPAWIYRLAQHFDTVVVMYSNMTDPEPGATDVRRVHELEGVPIPRTIRRRVKIFAIGSPKFGRLIESAIGPLLIEGPEAAAGERRDVSRSNRSARRRP